jgi:non-heme chloroperoxidase
LELVAPGHDGGRQGALRRQSQTDFTEDLKKINAPVLVMHSEDDQIMPYVAEGPLSAKLLKHSTFKSYKDLPHGMPTTPTRSMQIFLAFLKS